MQYNVKLYDDGRILIPAPLRKEWGLSAGQELLLTEENGMATLTTRAHMIQALKDHMNEVIPEDVSLVDQLIEERRRAAQDE